MKQRGFNREFKLHVLFEINSGKAAAEVARKYHLHPSTVSRWRRELKLYGDVAFSAACTGEGRWAVLERRIAQLQADNELLRKALSELSAICERQRKHI